jgi:hypothetical protein
LQQGEADRVVAQAAAEHVVPQFGRYGAFEGGDTFGGVRLALAGSIQVLRPLVKHAAVAAPVVRFLHAIVGVGNPGDDREAIHFQAGMALADFAQDFQAIQQRGQALVRYAGRNQSAVGEGVAGNQQDVATRRLPAQPGGEGT